MGTFVASRQVRQNINLMPAWWLSGASIDLDFDNARYYDSGLGASASLAPLNSYLSISRASTKYAKTAAGVLTNFGNDTLAITDLGLLIEDARTNLQVRSQDFTTTWSGGTVTADATAAPDGTVTADQVAFSGGGSIFGATWATDAQYAMSVYAKIASGANTWFPFRANQSGVTGQINCWFNLSGAGSVGTSNQSGNATFNSASIEALANGWYRCTVIATWSASGNNSKNLEFFAPSNADNTTTSTGSTAIYLWGAQVEQAAFASSYIPTVAASATRAQDSILTAGALTTLIQTLPNSLVVDLTALAAPNDFLRIIGDTGSGNSYLYSPSDNASAGQFNGSATLIATSLGGLTYTGGVKVGSSRGSSTGRTVVGGGGTIFTDANAAGSLTTPALGKSGSSSQTWFGYIRRATFWNSRLADATLQSLTAP